MGTLRVALLRHRDSTFDREVIGRSLAATTNLVGEVIVEPDRWRQLQTLKHEYRRSGILGLLDALVYRLYYRVALAKTEGEKIDTLIERTKARYPDYQARSVSVADPNNQATQTALHEFDPDVLVARTKVLLDESVYAIPTEGTFVIHPGICPEYRNQHGCFWALANGDDGKTGYSLLRIDDGIDTGEIFSQNGTVFDPIDDEHVYIQLKIVADNLTEISDTLVAVVNGDATPIETEGRESALWGMPKFSAWLTWKRRVKRFGIDEVDSRR